METTHTQSVTTFCFAVFLWRRIRTDTADVDVVVYNINQYRCHTYQDNTHMFDGRFDDDVGNRKLVDVVRVEMPSLGR